MPDENRIIGERYRLLELIGQGSAADVWRAHDLRLARDVALKLYRGDAAAELGGAQEEVRMLARLDHPNLVSVLDTGTEPDGTAWIVTSYVDGQSLAARLAHGRLPAEDVGIYGAEVAAALSYVHGQGLVHRDVKPGNVLVGTNGRVYLTDFGIARIVDSPSRTVADTVVGTPAFFAPEQVSGARVGPPADVYALGLLLLEALTGHREFPGAAMESAVARLHRDPVIPAHLTPPWRSLLAAMTTREPADRPTAAQVERRLRTLADPTATIVAPLAGTGLAGDALAGAGLAGAGLAGAGLAGDHTAILPPVRPAAEEYVYPPAPRRGGVNPTVLTLLVLIALAAIAAAVYLSLSGRGGTPLPAPATSSPAPTSAAPTSAAPTTPPPTSAAPTTPPPTSAAPTTPPPTSPAPPPTSPPITILPSSPVSS